MSAGKLAAGFLLRLDMKMILGCFTSLHGGPGITVGPICSAVRSHSVSQPGSRVLSTSQQTSPTETSRRMNCLFGTTLENSRFPTVANRPWWNLYKVVCPEANHPQGEETNCDSRTPRSPLNPDTALVAQLSIESPRLSALRSGNHLSSKKLPQMWVTYLFS